MAQETPIGNLGNMNQEDSQLVDSILNDLNSGQQQQQQQHQQQQPQYSQEQQQAMLAERQRELEMQQQILHLEIGFPTYHILHLLNLSCQCHKQLLLNNNIQYYD